MNTAAKLATHSKAQIHAMHLYGSVKFYSVFVVYSV